MSETILFSRYGIDLSRKDRATVRSPQTSSKVQITQLKSSNGEESSTTGDDMLDNEFERF